MSCVLAIGALLDEYQSIQNTRACFFSKQAMMEIFCGILAKMSLKIETRNAESRKLATRHEIWVKCDFGAFPRLLGLLSKCIVGILDLWSHNVEKSALWEVCYIDSPKLVDFSFFSDFVFILAMKHQKKTFCQVSMMKNGKNRHRDAYFGICLISMRFRRKLVFWR